MSLRWTRPPTVSFSVLLLDGSRVVVPDTHGLLFITFAWYDKDFKHERFRGATDGHDGDRIALLEELLSYVTTRKRIHQLGIIKYQVDILVAVSLVSTVTDELIM